MITFSVTENKYYYVTLVISISAQITPKTPTLPTTYTTQANDEPFIALIGLKIEQQERLHQ